MKEGEKKKGERGGRKGRGEEVLERERGVSPGSVCSALCCFFQWLVAGL